MKRYKIKSNETVQEYLTIERTCPGGFEVVISRIYEDYTEEKREFLPQSLFDTCLRTGYLTEIKESRIAQSA